ncbi:MAG: GtrA family protein [Candidatus Moraniibacteriota bacterium]
MQELTRRDLLFSAINGAIVGILAPFIFSNLSVSLHVSPVIFAVGLSLLSVVGIAVGYYLSKVLFPFLYQFAKFGLIGVANTVIDVGIYNLFITLTDISSGPLIVVFKTLSVFTAIINSYIWNKYWSFEQKETAEVSKEFGQFLAVSLTGLLINVGITYLVVNVVGSPKGMDPKIWANVGALTASLVGFGWNFVGYKFFVFKK